MEVKVAPMGSIAVVSGPGIQQKRAVYAGTFDPFHFGHFDILCKAAKLFDRIEIVLADNPDKVRRFPVRGMMEAIERFLITDGPCDDCKLSVIIHNGLVAEFCKEEGYDHLIRGLRNPLDYMAEENIARINKEIYPQLETVYFRSGGGGLHVTSSSYVKELFQMGMRKLIDLEWYRRYVPSTICEYMEGVGFVEA